MSPYFINEGASIARCDRKAGSTVHLLHVACHKAPERLLASKLTHHIDGSKHSVKFRAVATTQRPPDHQTTFISQLSPPWRWLTTVSTFSNLAPLQVAVASHPRAKPLVSTSHSTAGRTAYGAFTSMEPLASANAIRVGTITATTIMFSRVLTLSLSFSLSVKACARARAFPSMRQAPGVADAHRVFCARACFFCCTHHGPKGNRPFF